MCLEVLHVDDGQPENHEEHHHTDRRGVPHLRVGERSRVQVHGVEVGGPRRPARP